MAGGFFVVSGGAVSDDFPIPTWQEVAGEVLRRLAGLERGHLLILDAVDGVERRLMALSTQEQAQLDGIATDLADIDGAVSTIAAALPALTSVLDSQRAQIEAFIAQDLLDAADKAALQAIIDGNAADLDAALAPLRASADALRDRSKAIADSLADPATPLTPTP